MLATIIQRIKDTVVAPCLVEDESYAIRSRKLAVLCLAVMMSNALTMGLPMTVVIGVYDPNYGSFVLAAAMLHMFVFSSVVPYVYLRRTREMPQWMVDLQVWSTLPTLVAASLFMHQVSIPVVCVVVAMVAIMLRARLWWVFMLIMLGLILFTRLVVDFASELPALHSTFYREQLLVERITYTLGCSLCPPAFMCLGLYVVVQQFVQRSEEADAAIHMNLAVADKLQNYDTEGVSDILAAHVGIVDENLLNAFAAIQHNLQEYRPHIPDYVIAAANKSNIDALLAQDDEGSVQLDESKDFYAEISSSYHRRDESSVFGRKQSTRASFSYTGSGSPPRRGQSSFRLGGRLSLDISNTTSDTNNTDASTPTGGNLSLRHKYSGHKQHTPKNSNQPEVFFGRATTVVVRFSHATFGDVVGVLNAFNKREIVLKLNKCVAAVTKLAKAHGGALQYMQGCMALISFNAASRVAAHESKACTFIDALGDEMKKLPNMLMQASVVTSNILSFFAGDKGQLVLTVLGGYMYQHTSLHHFIQEVCPGISITLMTSSVVTTVESFFNCRLIGGVRCPSVFPDGHTIAAFMRRSPEQERLLISSDTDLLTVHQLVSAIDADGDEEWLYSLGDKKNVAYDAVVGLGFSHRLEEAKEALVQIASDGGISHDEESHSDWHGAEDIVVQLCVIDRLQKLSSDVISDFAVTTRPTRLW